ncbi:hypothetical protein HCN44_009290 [Aphidius gifuensis]|uniref:4'-phosphopantetheine phosphatase n=1 Tax=Aphidius gifuensis TaxID=684658 RepID=A0A835CVW7_APHGI|nr:4'-phosphopantetheine phosphatase [Aphidius gifuensis]KAF7997892.1 hypothetical protein HCN44_009290 [Aphidius gifuensis]
MADSDDKLSYPKSIKLPPSVEVFANLKNAQNFAMDIGLSLTKIAYYSTVSYRKALYEDESEASGETTYKVQEGSRLHFVKFETTHIENCLDFVKDHLVNAERFQGKSIKITGGGAFKYTSSIQSKLGLLVDKEDEICCLIKGCNFLLKNIPCESFEFEKNGNPEYKFEKAGPNIFPYLLVNIGSGVSILKVESDEEFERVGGTASGGGTFWGLGSLLTKAKGFDELLELAERGDHRNIDMLIKDIYGGDYSSQGLSGDLIASSFGKAMSCNNLQGAKKNFSEADIARSLLFTISNDIGQIASLYATIHNMDKVYFGGYFLRNHPLSMHTISFAIKYWSNNKVKPLFLRHEGYLGAIGAFLYGAEQSDQYSWLENYAGSSGFKDSIATGLGINIDQLEIDRAENAVTFCPLLKDPDTYNPDTTDLAQDKEARDYWLQCFEESVDKFIARAIHSQPHSPTAKDRASKLKEKYVNRLHYLHLQPFAYGTLTVRTLLDTIEHCMKEFDFPDPYLDQKKKENEEALSFLKERLDILDNLEGQEKLNALIIGVLAGNMFDWGAKEVADIMESTTFRFEDAQDKIPGRPWLEDNLDAWIERLQNESPHKCAAIFVDNSGVDIVLGILPFVRDLLQRGTKVILCANSMPALNDVTYPELLVILRDAAKISKDIKYALKENRLMPMETAQAGPCLDLSRLNLDLCLAMVKHNVDLVVIEGMGRTLHTNLHAKLRCECLKLAVVKNRWLSLRLGGDMFAVICKYERATLP